MAGDISKSINIAINVINGVSNQVGSIVASFGKITESVNKSTKAVENLNNQLNNLNLKPFTTNTRAANKQVGALGKSSQKTEASFSQWGYALGSASTGLSKFGTQIYGVTRGFSAVSKEMGLAMAAFTTSFATLFALKGVIKDIVEFDDAIRSAGAVAQASSTQLTQLSDAARAMGESTRYTAKDAAEALKALAMTGLDVNESIATLPTVLNLAAAANMDLGESADIVTNIMVGYGKTVADLPHIADLMTASFTNSNTSLQELGVALKYVGPVANAAGQSIEETTGILSSLANAGYRGSKAGTTLRTAFARLLSPTNKMSKALDHYGISMNDLVNENGTLKSFTTILDLMGKKSITAGDALTIFGKRAGPGMLALIGQGTPALEEMNRKIAESEGVALKVAYEMEAGLGGALRKLKSMWEEVSIAVGKTIEQDVQGFLEALTKSLKENKDQIIAVTSVMFKFVGVIAKVVGWLAQFILKHIKVISAMAAITASMKLLTMTSKQFMAIGIVNYFVKLYGSIKWSGIAFGIAGIANSLNTYSGAAKTATNINATLALQGLASTPYAAIKVGLYNIASGLVSVAVAAAKAAIAFMTANPVILGLTVAIGGLLALTKLLDNDYEGVAKSATKMATAAKEVNRELEYQLVELKLVDKEFKRDGATKFGDAEERLRDVIRKSNLSIEDKVKYLKKSREGTDSTKEAISELIEKIEAEKKANDDKQISKTTEARLAQAKAVEEQAKKLEYFYGVQVDGKTRLNKVEKASAELDKLNINQKAILWIKKKLGYLKDELDKYDELEAQQKIIGSNYGVMTAQMITSKKTAEEFKEAVVASGAASEDVDSLTAAYVKLQTQAEANKEVMDDLIKLSASAMEKLEDEAVKKIEIFKSENQDREAIAKQTLYNLAVLEAQGVVDHETAEMAKLQATLTSSQARVDAAKATYNTIDELAVDGREKAMEQIVAAEEEAANVRLQILQKIAEAEKVANEKIGSFNKKRIDENSRSETKLKDLRSDNNIKHTDAEDIKTARIKEINQTLHDKLVEIETKLADKRKEFAEKRVDIVKNATQRIKDIESSTEDKLRSIRQRGMSDVQKDADNRNAANKKLKEGQELVEQAKKNGDTAALERGTRLINQASDLYSGLESQKTATNGVKKASDELKEAEKVRTKIALQDLAKKVKEEEKAAARSIQIAKEAAANDKEKAKTSYDQKLQKADEYYAKEIKLEEKNHADKLENIKIQIDKYNEKLELIEKEKGLVLDLITQQQNLGNTEAGSEVWTKANAATEEAIQKVGDYGKAVDGINDKEVNIKLTGEASPKAPLGEKLEEIKRKFAEISTEIIVNVIFKTDGADLSTGLQTVKKQIESLEVIIPVIVDISQLDAVIKLINEYKKKDFQVVVVVDKRQLTDTENIYKRLVKKTVDIIIKVSGYDNLIKAKNLIDSIRSKTVTITTRHVEVKAKAMGGYIEPEQYASGGNVFKRLSSRFISSGGGKKDDVPALLMKGEFVQKVDAVKKYGKNFMARLNAGLIPKSVTKMFSNGGDVQPEHYARGGHVGHSNISSMLEFLPAGRRKKILDLFEDKITKMSASKIGEKASSITTEIGQTSIAKMSATMAQAVASFATGGSINQNLADLSSQKQQINSDYSLRVSEQEALGNTQIAELLTKEKDGLLAISENLKQELSNLKAEYDEYVKDATEAFNKDKSDRDNEYQKNSAASKKDFDEGNTDDDYQYTKDQESHTKDKLALDEEYKAKEAEVYSNLVSNREDLQEKANNLENLAKFVVEIGNINGGRRYISEDEFYFKENFTPTKWIGDPKNPDRKMIELQIATAFTHGKDTLGEKGKSDALNNLEKLWSEFEVSKSSIAQQGVENPVRMLQEAGFLDLQGLAKSINSEEKEDKITELDGSFKKVTDSYNKSKSERKASYSETSAENLAAYNEESADAKKSFDELLADTKKQYEENVSSATENGKSLSDELRESTKYDVESIKSSLSENLAQLKDDRDSQLRNVESAGESGSDIYNEPDPYTNTTYDTPTLRETEPYVPSAFENIKVPEAYREDLNESEARVVKRDSPLNTIPQLLSKLNQRRTEDNGAVKSDSFIPKSKPVQNISSTLFELLKRKYGIFGFNSGGYVNPTSSSVPGKDSILSALTPDEYVMKASVVRKFGKGFFDSLNNFRIPQFNTGGLVEGGSSMISGEATETVRHTLDLTINGSTKGTLIGSGPTISDILNDLTLAKLRS
jgi:TP901 family phage tail tape measure protein